MYNCDQDTRGTQIKKLLAIMKMKVAEPNNESYGSFVKKTIDEVLNETGLSSYRQLLIQLNFILFDLSIVYHLVLSFFVGSVPSWQCNESNSSVFCRQHFNRTIKQSDVLFQERCSLSRSEWNYTTDSKYSFVTEFGLDCGNTYLAAMISSSFFVGGVISAMINGKISAMYGRKRPLIALSILLVTTSIASGFVSNIWQLIGLNLLRGAGQVGSQYLVFIYQAELSPPKYRAVLSTVLLTAGSTSMLYIDLLAYYVRTWRDLSTYAALPCLPFLIGIFFFPESPRWLLANGEKDKMLKVLKILSKSKECKFKICYKEDVKKSSCTYLDFVRHPKAFRLTLANLLLWLTLPILYFTIALQAGNFGENMYVAFAISTAADIPACIILAFICDVLGRKKTILGGMFICSILLLLINLIPTSITMTTIIAIVARCACDLSLCGLFTWSNEIFPTVLRSQGMLLCSAFDRFGCVAVPFIIRVLKNWNDKSPFFVVSGLGLIATFVGISLPETSGKPTRETYEDFVEDQPKRIKCDTTRVPDIGVENTGVRTEESDLF